MKKFLPLILLLVGILVFVGVYFIFIRKPASVPETVPTETAPEIPLEKRPVTSLTPSADGHWLDLKVEKIQIQTASFDYELLYNLPDGRTQGVPGTIKLSGQTGIERNLLLGSESSGKYRYDQGVEKGTLTLRFRDDKGQLVAKFSTDFHLQSATKELSSVDGKFKISLSNQPIGVFYVTMQTFGLPQNIGSVASGPYGVFSSSSSKLVGSVILEGGKIQIWTGTSWVALTGNSFSPGIFVATSE